MSGRQVLSGAIISIFTIGALALLGSMLNSIRELEKHVSRDEVLVQGRYCGIHVCDDLMVRASAIDVRLNHLEKGQDRMMESIKILAVDRMGAK